MRIALFLTTEVAAAGALLAEVKRRHRDDALSVFVRDEHRAPLHSEFAGCDVRRDKPAGGRLRFLRELRRERFDLLIVAWHGGEQPQPLRLAALFAGARRVLAVDEKGSERAVAWYLPWTWAGHALRRLGAMKAATAALVLAALYRATVGLLVGGASLLLFAATRRRPTARTDAASRQRSATGS